MPRRRQRRRSILSNLKSANDDLAAANAAALDGGKKARAQKAHAKEVVVKLLDQLASYVQANCRDDMTIFLSSGFTAVSGQKTVKSPASDSIRKVELDEVSGQMRITLMEVSRCRQLRSSVGAGSCRRQSHGMGEPAGGFSAARDDHYRSDPPALTMCFRFVQ